MRRYGLHDDEWERIKGFLPGREGDVGVTAKDNRLFVEAVLYRYRTGMPWRDLPERFGDWKAVHTRFTRWAKALINRLSSSRSSRSLCNSAAIPAWSLCISLRAVNRSSIWL